MSLWQYAVAPRWPVTSGVGSSGPFPFQLCADIIVVPTMMHRVRVSPPTDDRVVSIPGWPRGGGQQKGGCYRPDVTVMKAPRNAHMNTDDAPPERASPMALTSLFKQLHGHQHREG